MMFDWITHLFNSSEDGARDPVVDPELLFQLQQALNECEAIYRSAAHVCRYECPEQIQGDPDAFVELMVDLHRGLLIKIFVEVSDCERRWHPEECDVAFELLRHVWGVHIANEDLLEVLHNVAELDSTLKWENVLGPFVRIPLLGDVVPELNTCVMRIANLIAKADGCILPAEAERLRFIHAEMDRVLKVGVRSEATSKPNVARAGAHVAELLQPAQQGASTANRSETSKAKAQSVSAAKQSPEAMLAEATDDLQKLVGLEALKKDVQQLVNFLKVQECRQTHQLPRTEISLHTVFVGNPGTGKTTVARILARILGGLRILEKGHTVETDRAGLVAEYAGQTGPKVNKRVDESLHGLLFIDEAYSLIAESGDDPYGNEAVQVLLKRMEDDRSRLVVVLAGYPEPMQRLLHSNPGLCSRFQRTFEFPDYGVDELLQIFDSFCLKAEYVLTESARGKLRSIFQAEFDRRDEYFGNGRLARNLFERAISRMASRIVEIAPVTRTLLTTLEADDFGDRDVSQKTELRSRRNL